MLTDGVKAAGGDALEALGAFGLTNGVVVCRAFAGVDQDHGGQGQQEKDAG
jgi:hypothetical protein